MRAPQNLEPTRQCKTCKQVKPYEDFPIAGVPVEGKIRYRGYKCKKCTYIWAAERLRIQKAKDPQLHAKMLERDRRRHYKNRNLVFDHYGWTCVCCGESNEALLNIDHIVEVGGNRRRELKQTALYCWIVRHGFPDDFRTLCYNCNIARSKFGGICPHQSSSQTMARASSRKCGEMPEIRKDQDIVETAMKVAAVSLSPWGLQ